ncbi:MAG: enoyl-CoA hydratase/carnithine racemase [Candidatus Poriferisodalaceae bacterium]|jgi:enoyl-CoA hydratase/carnithine racemase
MSIQSLNLETIEIEQQDAVLRVWFNRPERRNAHNLQMIREVGDLFDAINSTFDVRVVVVGGRGKSFCAGADRKGDAEAEPSNDRERRYNAQLGRRAARAIEDCEAITVARVHGHAIGGGCCFATSCDFRVTTSDALWYVPEVELGVPLPWGATPRLISEIGAARARQMILLSDRIDGTRAADWGLAHEVVADEAALDTAVDTWVDRLIKLPEVSLQMGKYQMRGYGQLTRLGDLSEFDGDASAAANSTAEARASFGSF